MNDCPAISVVINTDGRVRSLEVTLKSLRYLNYSKFEVCVVYGPTPDGTAELLATWGSQIKVAACPEKNLSMSRNIGIALAAGDIVAFTDDDAIPEPEWLDKIAVSYQQSDVGASGGYVFDHTGTKYWWRYGTIDRMARPDCSWRRPCPEFCFPFSRTVPYLPGTNSSLRRTAAIEIGGFDEEFDYSLDEADLLCRLNDAGWKIAQLEGGCVHHKYDMSGLPAVTRASKSWYSIIKNKMYFCLRNAGGHHTFHEAIAEATRYTEDYSKSVERAIAAGHLGERDRARFDEDAERAWSRALWQGLSEKRRLMPPGLLGRYAAPFLKFNPILVVGRRRTLCLLSQGYPPHGVGGIARYVRQLAQTLAICGHHVRVLTSAPEHDTVNFEDGVWIHRIRSRPQSKKPTAVEMAVPQHIWDYSATMLAEVEKIAEARPVHAVIAPIWDCEGLAILLDGRFRLITSLHTTLKFYLDAHDYLKSNIAFVESFVEPMLAAERLLLERSAGILANSNAIITEIEEQYHVRFGGSRVALVPHGIHDWTKLDWVPAQTLPRGALRLLFVGRLEERKGIDVFLEAIKKVLPDYKGVHVDIAGNGNWTGKNHKTFRELFADDSGADAIRDRVCFHGEVPDADLRGLYRACDIFIAPSRFESFGLILLEAMMFAKPVIACRAGGMVEIIEHGESGFLAEPGDVESLAKLICQLVQDVDLRQRIGLAGRRRYEALFSSERMAEGVLAAVDRFGANIDEGCATMKPQRRDGIKPVP